MKNHTPPLSTKFMIVALLLALIVVSFLAGFYQVSWQASEKRYKRIENLYVRLRNELGVDEVKRLIEQSQQNEMKEYYGL